jgi:hypothetical protein
VLCVACVRRCAWSDVTSVCILLFDRCERQWARSERVAVLLRCCACGTALHWTVAAAVSGSSRAAAVAIRGCSRSGYCAVS